MERILQQLSSGFHIPLQNPVLIFSLILAIILLAPVLLRKLNIPSIIGLIISGAVIGPFGLNILEKNSAVELFSTIGLLYIMFIAGLELDFSEFRTNKFKNFLFGLFTFFTPIIVGFPIMFYVLDYDLLPAMLIASMFSTRTLVAYPIVSKLGISKNKAVAVSVGGTIIADTGVLIALTMLLGAEHGGTGKDFWIQTILSIFLFAIIMFAAVPRIAKWFFNKLESEKYSHYIFVLAVVFFSAFLAEVAGMEPIIGAFAAGLSLNKLIPATSSLMNRIEFIGNSLFIPFFLISVGMLVNVRLLFEGYEALLIAAILAVVSLSGKWMAALATQIIFGFSRAQRSLVFGLSSAHAAAVLAISLVGNKAGLIDEVILNGIIILILITCIFSSFVTERAARKVVLEMDNAPITPENGKNVHKEHILIPVTKIRSMEKMIDFVALLKDHKSLHPITMLAIVPNDEDSEGKIIKAQNDLEKCVKHASATETKVNIAVTIDQHFLSGVARKSREIMAETIVLPWPEEGDLIDKKSEFRLDNLLEQINKSLFICHLNKPASAYKRIIVVAPPYTEKESDFGFLMGKIIKLAGELKTEMVFFSNGVTRGAIANALIVLKNQVSNELRPFDNWDDFLILSRFIREDDIMVVIGARKGSFSYNQQLDSIPAKLEKYFSRNTRIIFYPKQISSRSIIDSYGDITHEPLSIGLEAVQKIGKEIGNIFKKE
ncbi:MAG TPA: cation:proton antiporter, partial [Bacteroidales bacterium]|nr:cation:proton antiporter [Bacteroidales bacterium]